MILRLAAEQARSQRRFTIWTAALMTLALTSVAFALMLVATQRAMWDDAIRVSLADRAHIVVGPQYFGEVPDVESLPPAWDLMSVEEVDRSVAEAIANGSDVAAIREWAVVTRPTTSFSQLMLAAATGDYDWDLVLASGRLPGNGEILLNARVADELNLGVGDTIDLNYALHPPTSGEPVVEADWHTFTISGLSRAADWGNPLFTDIWYVPDYSYVSWEASSSPDGPFACRLCTIDDQGHTATFIPSSTTAWNIDDAALSGLPTQSSPDAIVEFMMSEAPSVPPAAIVGYVLAALVTFGMILGAFGVGRAQAQTRLQWVATARTLGATRRAVVGATLLESLLVATAATVASLTLGYGAANIAFSLMRGFDGPILGPSHVPMTWWVVAAVAVIGAVLSLIVAAVPAFWASRVSPVAAFKPVTDVTEAEVSRRVPVWWMAPGFAGGLVALWLGTREQGPAGFVAYLGAILAGTTGFVLLKEGLRTLLIARGRWFARTRFAPLKAAGDSIVASSRSATANALLFAIPLAIIVWIQVVSNFSNLETHLTSGRPSETWPLPGHESAVVWATGGLLWALGLLAEFECVALAITFANRSASAADAATRRALGLSTLQQRQAAYVQHVVPQVGGAIVGTCLGFILGIATYFLAPGGSTRPGSAGDYLPAWWTSALSAGYLIALAGVFAALGGFIVAAAASRVRTPIEGLKPTGKVHAR
jgi:ABC-type lipoprotein release transport system permease subunit